jgi:hypothetical protein
MALAATGHIAHMKKSPRVTFKVLRIAENDSQDCGSPILLWINVLHGVAPR